MKTRTPPPTIALLSLAAGEHRLVQHAASVCGLSCQSYASTEAFLAAPTACKPGCLVADLTANGPAVCELATHMLTARLSCKLLLFADADDIEQVVRAMQLGAHDVLTRPIDLPDLVCDLQDAVHASRDEHVNLQWQQECLRRRAMLSPREAAVLDLVLAGLTNRQMADQLGISHRTIEVHRGRIMRKFHANTVPEMVRVAVTAQVVDDILSHQLSGAPPYNAEATPPTRLNTAG